MEADYALVSDSSLTCAPLVWLLLFGAATPLPAKSKKDDGDELASSIACVDSEFFPFFKDVAQRSPHGADAITLARRRAAIDVGRWRDGFGFESDAAIRRSAMLTCPVWHCHRLSRPGYLTEARPIFC